MFLHKQNWQYLFSKWQQIVETLFYCVLEKPHALSIYFLSSLLTSIKLILHVVLQCASHKNGTCPLLFYAF